MNQLNNGMVVEVKVGIMMDEVTEDSLLLLVELEYHRSCLSLMQLMVVAEMKPEMMMVLEAVKLLWENGSDDKSRVEGV